MVIILIYLLQKKIIQSIFAVIFFFTEKNQNKMQSLLKAVKKHVSRSNQWKNEGFLIA